MAFRDFTATEWLDELEDGLEYRRRFGIEDKWGEMEAMYYNVHPSMANDGPNILMSTGDSMLSTVTVPNARVIVKPRTSEAVAKVALLEALDNLLLGELNVKEEVERASLHAYIFGRGIVKVGFDSEFGFDPSRDVGGALRLGFTLTQLDSRGKRRIEHNSGVSPGMPWVIAVPPHDLIVPWGTLRLDRCPWIAHRICRQIDDLKADSKYENTRNLIPTMSMESFVDSYKTPIKTLRPRNTREPEFVEMFEIHDRRTGRIMVVVPGAAANNERFVRNEPNALQIDNRLPFVALGFTPATRTFWTTPDTHYLRHAQMSLSDISVQSTKQRRLSVLKFLYDEGVINELELNKLLSADVGVAAKINEGTDIAKAILPIQNNAVNQGMIMEEEHVRRNAREQLGFSRNQLGEFTGGRRTATEAKIVDQASALRMSRRGLAVKTFYEEIIQTINGIIFEHWTLPRYIEVIGESAASDWQAVNGPSLKSRYAYEVTFTDDQELRQRRMEALQMYQMLTQDPSIDPIALRQYLTDAYNDPEFARLFNADVSNAMRALRLQSHVVQSQNGEQPGGGSGRMAGMPGVPSSNGQNGFAGMLPGGQ